LIILAVVAICLVAFGVKNIQVGGLIDSLLGKKVKKAVDIANTIPEDRVTPDGKLIQPGEPDSKGIIQARVVPLVSPGLFDDKTNVTILDPDTQKKVTVVVPDGVKPSDVESVVVISPEITIVSVKSSSKVESTSVDLLLRKYGK
jgi:hypothetical protein